MSAATDGTTRIFFLPPYTVALLWFEPTSLTSVELHRDPGPLEGLSTN